MKLLITGPFGFIGRHLLNSLKDSDFSKISLITKRSSSGGEVSDKFSHYPIGLENQRDLKDLIDPETIIIHLAWDSTPSTTSDDLSKEVNLNVQGSINLLEAGVIAGMKKFIFISSGGTVYGNPKVVPIKEDHATEPISAYGLAKLMVERSVILKSQLYNIPYNILRPSNVYGPGFRLDKGQGVIGFWINNIKKNQAAIKYGDGEIIRDFVYIDDMINAMHLFFNNNTSGIYNIGSGKGISINEVLKILQANSKKPLLISERTGRKFDVLNNTLDIEKIHNELGWRPEIGLEEGILTTLRAENNFTL